MPKGADGEATEVMALSRDSPVENKEDELFENSADEAVNTPFNGMDSNVKTKNNDFAFSDEEEGIRLKFKPYKDIISNLTNMKLLETESDVVSCDMSNDSTRLLVVLKTTDEHFQVKQFCTKKFQCKFSHDLEADYIKAAKIIQDKHGEMYCLPFLKDGTFHLLIFNKKTVITDFEINKELELDNQTRPNDNFPYPMMDACFLTNQNLFVNVFHTCLHKVFTFRYSIL